MYLFILLRSYVPLPEEGVDNINSADWKIDETYQISTNLQLFQVGQLGEYSFLEFNYVITVKIPKVTKVQNLACVGGKF